MLCLLVCFSFELSYVTPTGVGFQSLTNFELFSHCYVNVGAESVNIESLHMYAAVFFSIALIFL